MKIINALMVAFLLPLTACQKKDDVAPDANKVTMNITSLKPGQAFSSGDTIYIKGIVTYPGELHGYEVKIIDTSSGFILYDDAQHIHADSFTIDDEWVCAANQSLGLKLTIIVNLDHDGDNAQKEILLSVNP